MIIVNNTNINTKNFYSILEELLLKTDSHDEIEQLIFFTVINGKFKKFDFIIKKNCYNLSKNLKDMFCAEATHLEYKYICSNNTKLRNLLSECFTYCKSKSRSAGLNSSNCKSCNRESFGRLLYKLQSRCLKDCKSCSDDTQFDKIFKRLIKKLFDDLSIIGNISIYKPTEILYDVFHNILSNYLPLNKYDTRFTLFLSLCYQSFDAISCIALFDDNKKYILMNIAIKKKDISVYMASRMALFPRDLNKLADNCIDTAFECNNICAIYYMIKNEYSLEILYKIIECYKKDNTLRNLKGLDIIFESLISKNKICNNNKSSCLKINYDIYNYLCNVLITSSSVFLFDKLICNTHSNNILRVIRYYQNTFCEEILEEVNLSKQILKDEKINKSIDSIINNFRHIKESIYSYL